MNILYVFKYKYKNVNTIYTCLDIIKWKVKNRGL
jgi:hypothetical protein